MTTFIQSQDHQSTFLGDDVIEVVLEPNFDSPIPHEVLGCDIYSSEEDIDRAYRDLSRKYHPSKETTSSSTQQQQEYSQIFQKISTAYTRIKTADGDNESLIHVTTPENLYEKMFGKYHELYYNDGGMIGLPYSSDLYERLQSTTKYRNVFSVPLCRVSSTSTTQQQRQHNYD